MLYLELKGYNDPINQQGYLIGWTCKSLLTTNKLLYKHLKYRY